MTFTKPLGMLGLSSLCIAAILAGGCKTYYSNNDCSFGEEEQLAIEDEFYTGENPMPQALSPVKSEDVVYPAPKTPKTKEYWQEHADPYEGLIPAPKTKIEVPAPQGFVKYTIKKGDTLGGIAKKNNLSLKSVKAANGGINYDRLRIGQVIYLPTAKDASQKQVVSKTNSAATAAGGVYIVKNGDILGRIARANGVKVSELKAANGLKSDMIKVGQKLIIPSKTGTQATKKVTPAPKADAPKKADNTKKAEPKRESVPEVEVKTDLPETLPEPPQIELPKFDTSNIEMPALPASAQPALETAPVTIPTPTPQQATVSKHIVQEKEDLFSISINWSVDIDAIKAANPDLGDYPTPGTVINIPVK